MGTIGLPDFLAIITSSGMASPVATACGDGGNCAKPVVAVKKLAPPALLPHFHPLSAQGQFSAFSAVALHLIFIFYLFICPELSFGGN